MCQHFLPIGRFSKHFHVACEVMADRCSKSQIQQVLRNIRRSVDRGTTSLRLLAFAVSQPWANEQSHAKANTCSQRAMRSNTTQQEEYKSEAGGSRKAAQFLPNIRFPKPAPWSSHCTNSQATQFLSSARCPKPSSGAKTTKQHNSFPI